MGNKYSTLIHHPSEQKHDLIIDKFKRIPHMMSNNRLLIYDNLKEIVIDLIVILCSNELSFFNYNEIASRLSANKMIVVCVKINSSEKKNPMMLCSDHTKYDTAIFNIIKNLKNEFVINYSKKLLIGSTTLCAHNSSYNICIDELSKKYNVILIDPIINSSIQIIEANNTKLHVLLPGDYKNIAITSQCLKKITRNILVLSDVMTNYFYNISLSNLREINEKSVHWDLITKTILNIIIFSYKQNPH